MLWYSHLHGPQLCGTPAFIWQGSQLCGNYPPRVSLALRAVLDHLLGKANLLI